MTEKSHVSVKDLHVNAKTDSGRMVEIIKGVSFEVARGEMVSLIGESGSGKTTIALSLMGHTRTGCNIASGDIRVGDNTVTSMTARSQAVLRQPRPAT